MCGLYRTVVLVGFGAGLAHRIVINKKLPKLNKNYRDLILNLLLLSCLFTESVGKNNNKITDGGIFFGEVNLR